MRQTKDTYRQRGFTLIELLLYIALTSSILVSAVYFVATALDARVKGQTVIEVEQQGNAALETITQTLRNANALTTPASGSSATLHVTVADAGRSPTIFSLSNGRLFIQEGASTAVALTNNLVSVSNVTFTNLSKPGTPPIVQVAFTISRINPANRNEYDYQQTFTGSAVIKDGL